MGEAESLPDIESLKSESESLHSGMGAIAWATLEMFRRGGMSQTDILEVMEKMSTYFAKPTNAECNAILSVVEERLQSDKNSSGTWY